MELNDNIQLSYPYFLYPGFPFHGYRNIFQYNINIIKLKNYIDSLINEINEPIILHFSFGAIMEEYLSEYNDNEYIYQWRQLFPYHLENCLKKFNNIKMIHIIISPNKTFEFGPFYKSPLFVNLSDITFIDDNMGTIHTSEYNFTTKIFNTMMPSKDINNNKFINEINKQNLLFDFNINDYKQIEIDINFINDFYQSLNNLINKVNTYRGCVTGFSYAVFNTSNNRSSFNNYNLFREIISVFNNNSTLLCEWDFNNFNSNYMIYNYTKILYLDNISIIDISLLKNSKYIDYEYIHNQYTLHLVKNSLF